MSKHDNDNLGVCGLCGRDPQKLEAEIEQLEAELAAVTEQRNLALREARAELKAKIRLLTFMGDVCDNQGSCREQE